MLRMLVLYSANTRRWPNVELLLGRRRRRRANFNSTLGQSLVLAGYKHIIYILYNNYLISIADIMTLLSKHETLAQRCFTVEPKSQTAGQQ